jgi:hypothetical protein
MWLVWIQVDHIHLSTHQKNEFGDGIIYSKSIQESGRNIFNVLIKWSGIILQQGRYKKWGGERNFNQTKYYNNNNNNENNKKSDDHMIKFYIT